MWGLADVGLCPQELVHDSLAPASLNQWNLFPFEMPIEDSSRLHACGFQRGWATGEASSLVCFSERRSMAAPTNPAKSGWAFSGLLLNSGWN